MLYETVDTTLDRSEQMLRQELFFHTIRLHCQTNHPALLRMLGVLLDRFPRCATPSGEARYSVFCYCDPAQFPVPLPRHRLRLGEMQLLTGTHLKYYRDNDGVREYQSYIVQPQVNAAALSVIDVRQHEALTQLEPLERYEAAFLQRYVLLLALGRLLHPYGFEPCHAAAICAPWDHRQGALIIGSSGSGKTTLSLGCAIAGCGLLGDDLVMMRYDEREGKVLAHSIMPEISVRSGSLDLLEQLSFLKASPADARGKRYCAIEQLGQGVSCPDVPIGILIFPTLVSGTRSTLIPLSKAQTLQALIEHSIGKESLYPEEQELAFSLLSVLVEQACGYQLKIARGNTDGPEMVCSLFKR